MAIIPLANSFEFSRLSLMTMTCAIYKQVGCEKVHRELITHLILNERCGPLSQYTKKLLPTRSQFDRIIPDHDDR